MSATAKTTYRTAAGFVVELSLSAETGAEVLKAIGAAQDHIMQHGGQPLDPFAAPSASAIAASLRGQVGAGLNGQPEGGGQAPGWCGIHGVQMAWNEASDGRAGWFSHRAPDGSWCKGKPKRG